MVGMNLMLEVLSAVADAAIIVGTIWQFLRRVEP